MKTLIKLFIVFGAGLTILNAADAQGTKKERQAANKSAIKKMVDNNNYTFQANLVIPTNGGSRQLTSLYDLRVTRDTIVSFLPYFGRAYLAPSPADNEGGIKFTSTNFNYRNKLQKNGGWEVLIKPKDNDITNWRDVQQLRLDISADGYASLFVISTNRDPISFEGNIVAKQ